MSRNSAELHPRVRARHAQFVAVCGALGIEIITTCTYRSNDEQAALYARGRTAPGSIVTNVGPGKSKHNFTIDGIPNSLAFDVVPVRDGKLVWGTKGDGLDLNVADDATDDLELWQRLGLIGQLCNLEWGGNWKKFKDYPHFQLPSEEPV